MWLNDFFWGEKKIEPGEAVQKKPDQDNRYRHERRW